MRHEEVIISGFGGQGALFAGQLLAHAGIAAGLHVTWLPSYGPEMRGGTANCTVILSEEEIGALLVHSPGAAVVLNLPSMCKYEPLVKPGGWLIVNTTLVSAPPQRRDVRFVGIPATQVATALGNPRMANMVLLGALVQATDIVPLETVLTELGRRLEERHRRWWEPNRQALAEGARLAAIELGVTAAAS